MNDKLKLVDNVIDIDVATRRNVPETLREIADSIDAGIFGNVTESAMAVNCDDGIICFYSGPGDGASAHLLFACAQRKMESGVLNECG
mgnify:FL=1